VAAYRFGSPVGALAFPGESPGETRVFDTAGNAFWIFRLRPVPRRGDDRMAGKNALRGIVGKGPHLDKGFKRPLTFQRQRIDVRSNCAGGHAATLGLHFAY
jgi:hypothetical protein